MFQSFISNMANMNSQDLYKQKFCGPLQFFNCIKQS